MITALIKRRKGYVKENKADYNIEEPKKEFL